VARRQVVLEDAVTPYILLAYLPILLLLALLVRRSGKAPQQQQATAMQHYRQLEALLSIMAVLKPTRPLPPMRGFAASPDFLLLLMERIFTDTPELVVEASSGVSTLITAYCLKQLGRGHVVSLEHDAPYVQQTQDLLALHGVSEYATVLHAPLVEYPLSTGVWRWYRLSDLPTDRPIDLLVVDGPPGALQPLSRYPALPLLEQYLSGKASILVDDANRPDEQEMVRRWVAEHRGWSARHYETETGAVALRRTP
jgi:predicted O-methyltransferase YrrM